MTKLRTDLNRSKIKLKTYLELNDSDCYSIAESQPSK